MALGRRVIGQRPEAMTLWQVKTGAILTLVFWVLSTAYKDEQCSTSPAIVSLFFSL